MVDDIDFVDEKLDFFISYDPQDQEWANWVLWQIEHQGFTAVAEPISVNTSMDYINFVKEAQSKTSHLILLCSPFYLTPELSTEIWQTIFPEGRFGDSGMLIPIRVQECDLDEFTTKFFDFVSLDETQCMTILSNVLEPVRQGKAPQVSVGTDEENPQVELVSSDGSVMQLTSMDDSEDEDVVSVEKAIASENPDLQENIARLEDVLNETSTTDVEPELGSEPEEDEIISLDNELKLDQSDFDEIGQPVDEIMSTLSEGAVDESDMEAPDIDASDVEVAESDSVSDDIIDTHLNVFDDDEDDELIFGLDDEVDFEAILESDESPSEEDPAEDAPELTETASEIVEAASELTETVPEIVEAAPEIVETDISEEVLEVAEQTTNEFSSFDDDLNLDDDLTLDEDLALDGDFTLEDGEDLDDAYASDENDDEFGSAESDDDELSLGDDAFGDAEDILDEDAIESEIDGLDDLEVASEEEVEPSLDLKVATEYSDCVWNIKMGRLSNFVGREEPLRGLHNYLFSDDASHTSMVSISGFPGVGKTQLVLEYSIQHESNYQVIWWVDASTPRSINKAFFDLLTVLDPDASPYDKAESVREKVFQHLAEKEHWLIVLDNVQDPDYCIGLFPKLPSGHVIYTSLRHHWPETVWSINLEPFKFSAASEYLLRRTRFTDVESARKLIAELGALPLALSQAAGYINRSQISISHYHQLLLKQRSRLWERELPVENYGKTISERYHELLEDIKNDNPLLFNFLQYLSVMEHSRIPLTLFTTSAHLFPSELAEIFKDDIALSDFIYPLLNTSLLVREGEYVSVAPLLKYVVLDHLDDSQTANLVLEIFSCLDETFVYDYFSMEKWELCIALDPHIEALIDLAEQLNLHKAIMPNLANRLGRLRRDQGHYISSRIILDRAEQLLKTQMSDDTDLLLSIKNNLGLTNSYLQDFELAENQLKFALETQISANGDESKEMAHLLHSFGVMYRLRRDNGNAQSYLERSIEMKEKFFGPDSPLVASSLESLAAVLFDSGNMEAADSNFEFARKIYSKSLPPDHPDVAYCLSNIAVIHQIKGESQDAYAMFKRSVEIFDKSFNSGHPNAILARKNFARFYESEGDYEMAESLYMHLQPIVEERYGVESYEVAKVLMDLARVSIELSKVDDAGVLLRQAEKIVIKEFGAEHINNGHIFRINSDIKYVSEDLEGAIRDLKRAISLFEKKHENHKRLLAEMYQDLGLLQEADNDHNSARFAFEQALIILDEQFPANNPDKAYSQFFLARALSSLRDYSEAVDQYMRCLTQFEQLFGEDSLEVALVNNGIGVVQMRRRQYSEAIIYFQKSGRVRLQRLGSDNIRTANSLNNIAMCKHFLGKTSEASSYFDRVLQVYQKHYGRHHHQLAACYNNLGLVLLDQRKFDEAQPYFEKAYQIYENVFSNDDERTCIAAYNYARCLYETGKYKVASEIIDDALAFFLVESGQRSQYAAQAQDLQERIFNKLN